MSLQKDLFSTSFTDADLSKDDLYLHIKQLPKLDLHRHITGSIRIDTIINIINKYYDKIKLPKGKSSIDDVVNSVIVKKPYKNVSSLIKNVWPSINAIIVHPDILRQILMEAIEDAYQDNVRYVEFRISPFGLTNGVQFTLTDTISSLLKAIEESKYLFPTTKAKLILSVSRHSLINKYSFKDIDKILLNLLELVTSKKNNSIVGFDIAGYEKNIPLAYFADFFIEASRRGFQTTVHCGEEGPAKEIEYAIYKLGVNRIGHGLSATKRNKIVLDILRDSGVGVEVCLSSNYYTSKISNFDFSNHPLKILKKNGIRFCICTDDPSVFNTSSTKELFIYYTYLSKDLNDYTNFFKSQCQMSFASEEEKNQLINLSY